MDENGYLHALGDAGRAMASLAERTPPGVAIPTCPGWTVEDLLRHLGVVHRWATAIVGTPAHERPRHEAFEPGALDARSELVSWFRQGHATLLQTLEAAPADVDCWTFFDAPSPRTFWSRRQAHETVLHLVDLALTAGEAPDQAPAAFAADGIDELLGGMLRGRPPEPDRDDAPRLRIIATDADVDLQVGFAGTRGVTLAPGTDGARPAVCVITARAIDLYLLLWNRRGADGLHVEGDERVLGAWATTRQVH